MGGETTPKNEGKAVGEPMVQKKFILENWESTISLFLRFARKFQRSEVPSFFQQEGEKIHHSPTCTVRYPTLFFMDWKFEASFPPKNKGWLDSERYSPSDSMEKKRFPKKEETRFL